MAIMGVAESAQELGISARRIRQLIDSGALKASRVGKSWVVDVESVEERKRSERHAGRPLAPKNAWRLALLAEPDSAHGERSPWKVEEVSAPERWRARRALRALLESGDLAVIDSKLRARCDRVEHRFAHPSVLENLADDPSLVVSGQRGASILGGDLVADDRIEGYIDREAVGRIDKRYRLQPVDAKEANVVLRVLDEPVVKSRGRVAPRLLIAADLSQSRDARARRAAEKLLHSVRRSK